MDDPSARSSRYSFSQSVPQPHAAAVAVVYNDPADATKSAAKGKYLTILRNTRVMQCKVTLLNIESHTGCLAVLYFTVYSTICGIECT